MSHLSAAADLSSSASPPSSSFRASSVVPTSVGVRLDRSELLLLVSSALSSLGCVETVRALRRETGITSEQRAVERVRAAILAGEWQQAKLKCSKLLAGQAQPAEDRNKDRQQQQHYPHSSSLNHATERVSTMLLAGRFLDQLHSANHRTAAAHRGAQHAHSAYRHSPTAGRRR